MKRRRYLSALLGAATATGVASAQEGNSTTSPTATPKGDRVAVELGPVVLVRSWSYEDGTFRIVLESDLPSGIKITDTGAVMKAMTEGSGGRAVQIPTRGYTLESGRTTVEFQPVEFDDAAAVTIASTKGAALIRTDSVDAGSPNVEMGTAVGATATAALGSGWFSFRKGREKMEESDEPEAERIA